MNLTEQLHHLREQARKVPTVVSQRRLEEHYQLDIDGIVMPQEVDFADRTLGKLKYRLGVLNLFWKAPETLSTEHRLGVVMFVGLVSRIDDLLDSEEFPRFGCEEEMRRYILDQPAHPFRSGYSIDTARRSMMLRFHDAADKQEAVDCFFDSALHTQFGIRDRLQGYGYAEALAYREATTGLYVEVGGKLADLSSEDIARVRLASMLWQRIDDAADLTDIGITQNLYIGLARDLGELHIIERAREKGMLYQGALPFVEAQKQIKAVVRATTATRMLYRQLFDRQYVTLGKPMVALSALRNLVL